MIHFSFEGSPEIIKESATRALSVLPATVPDAVRRRLMIGMQEVLLNAWEHGVLGISADEKIRLLNIGTFEEERRLRHAKLAGDSLLIGVQSDFSQGVFHCVVTDPGRGFGWRDQVTALTHDESEKPADDLSGRGLRLIKAIFHDVSWNETGNAVAVSWSEVQS